MFKSTAPTSKPPVLPTRAAVVEPVQRATLPSRVLQPSRVPQQLAFQFHR